MVDDPTTLLLQRTRRRLFALLEELRRPASTGELAAGLGMHPNGVRTHLALMSDAGLLVRHRVRLARGRPRDAWAIAQTARSEGQSVVAYQTVARWLARSIPPTPARLREVEAAGRGIGREVAAGRGIGRDLATAHDGGGVAEALVELLAGLGFQPEVEAARGGMLSCRLRNCPYRESVRANQPVVCRLHRGITVGALEVLAPEATLERFVPHDPDEAGCEVDVAVPEPIEAR